MGIILSVLSVVVGYAAMAGLVMAGHFVTSRLMLTGPHPTPAYINVNLGIGLAAAIAGGLVCGWVAPHNPFIHAMVLAGAVGSMSVAMLLIGPQPGQPNWYPLAVMLGGVVGVLIGGALVGYGPL